MTLPPLDVNSEALIPLSEISKLSGANKSTVWRWVHYGNEGVRLAARKIGGRWMTSKEAFQRFCDAVTENALGPSQETESVARPTTVRQRGIEASEQQREAERGLRTAGICGGGGVFAKSSASKEVLCDLHEYLEKWLPTCPSTARDIARSYSLVKDGLFERAAEILEGKHGKARSLKAAISWLEGIDLLAFDVTQLPGVGPVSKDSWSSILKMPGVAAQIRRLVKAEESTDPLVSNDKTRTAQE